MKRYFLILLLLSNFAVSAQLPDPRRQKDVVEEAFGVSPTNSKVKDGVFVRYVITTKKDTFLLESGNYANNQKDGAWEYFFYKRFDVYKIYALASQGNFVNGKKHGIWTEYYVPNPTQEKSTESKKNERALLSEYQIPGLRPTEHVITTNGNDQLIVADKLRPRVVGQYENDKRIGEWTISDSTGVARLRYNFSTRTLLQYDGQHELMQNPKSHRAIFLGSEKDLEQLLHQKLELPIVLPPLRDSSSVVVSFKVDKEGKVSKGSIKKNSYHPTIHDEILKVIPVLTDQWIPAVENGEFVDSNYLVSFDFIPTTKEAEEKSKEVTPKVATIKIRSVTAL